MLRTLDPYTTYIDPDTLNRFKQEVQGVFTGIGIQIRKDASTDLLLVVTPIKGSPAYKAGLLAGDLITKITREVDSDGNALPKPEVTDTKGLVVGDAVKKILGQPDTKVKLTVQREGVEGTKEYEITRGRVEVETVFGVKRKTNDDWDFMLDKDKKIGYLRLSQFQEDSYNDIVAAMQDLKKQGVKGFILDLRFNPGGLLTAAVDISDLFMDDGVIVSIRPRGKPEEFIRGKHEGSLLDFPMVCMVNGDSASASEIVSACLQDHHRAYIIGERSFGKGSVQNIRKFGEGELKLTTATFWRPSGKNLYKRLPGAVEKDEWGVKPDQVVPLTEKERGRTVRQPAQQRGHPAARRADEDGEGPQAGVQGRAVGAGRRVPDEPAQDGCKQSGEEGRISSERARPAGKAVDSLQAHGATRGPVLFPGGRFAGSPILAHDWTGGPDWLPLRQAGPARPPFSPAPVRSPFGTVRRQRNRS